MLRYWYKLNGDSQNYGIGNEKFVSGGEYSELYPKFFYKNALIYNGKSAANIPAGDDLVYTLTETLTKYSISVWYYVHSSHTNHGNNVHMIKLINGTNYSYIDQFWDPQSNPQWRHLCLTYDGQNQNIYINGVLKEEINFSEGQITSLGFMDKDEVRGGLTDLKIFDHVLSNKEIEELSKGLLVHIPFNNLSVPSVTLSDYVPGQGYVNYTSTLTKDSSVQTGSLPNIPKEWIMQHLGETVCASAYVYSLGSYIAGTINGSFGIRYALKYIDINDIEKQIYPLYLCVPGQNELYYVTWTIPSDIKSCTTDLIINNYTLGVQSNPEFGATPDQYGVTWTFSHFKVELGDYPTSPLGNPQLIEDTSGHNYYGTIKDVSKVCSVSYTPKYDTGILIKGSSTLGVNSTFYVSNLKDTYGNLPTDQFTISVFAKILTNYTNYTRILSYMDDLTVTGFEIYYRKLNNSIALNVVSNNQTVLNPSFTNINMENQFYHFAIKLYDSKLYIYINGILKTSVDAVLPENLTAPSLNRHSVGDIAYSDYKIYRTALSDQQIKDLYNESAVIDNNGNIFTNELNEL